MVPSEDQLRGICEDLLTDWRDSYADLSSIDLQSPGQPADGVRFSVVFAFASHAHHVTTTGADLMQADNYLSAIPLLRVGYEAALTAAWAAHSEDASAALAGVYAANTHKLYASASRVGWFDDLLAEPSPEPVPEAAPSSSGEAGAFANLCLSLEPNGEWLYTAYRLLSGYSHPSGSITKAYVDDTDGLSVSIAPSPPSDTIAWWHSAATNLLHAGQALDHLDKSHRRQNKLEEAGELLGWTQRLQLTSAAAAKVAAARKQRDARMSAGAPNVSEDDA